eukprot:NODE_7_length_48057_cov_0.322240.p7 type:complete len:449 gc:universal NODE_7_length_48057_cov_0.322240:39505-38159(-)
MSTGTLAERAALKKKELEERIILRSIIVPNDDKIVIKVLDVLREVPLSSPEKRKEQLRQVLYQRKKNNLPFTVEYILENKNKNDTDDNEEYWSVGSKHLLMFRRNLATKSLQLASKRLEYLQELSQTPLSVWKDNQKKYQEKYKKMLPISSSAITSRPITALQVSGQDESKIVVGDMGGKLILSTLRNDELIGIYESSEHQGRIASVNWNPYALLDDSVSHFSSCGNDGIVYMYNVESDDPLAKLEAHSSRCNKLIHLNSSTFITCGFDQLVKVWDSNSMKCIYEQSGHDREVYTVSGHPDESLLYSGDLGGIGRIWDLRTGRSISLLNDDRGGILTSLWHPNGFWLFTAGEDRVVRLYDIRQLKQFYEIPAHSQNISHMQLHTQELRNPNALLTVSFDQTVKIWSENDWNLEFSQEAHDGKITCADWKNKLYTGGFDRMVKYWDYDE